MLIAHNGACRPTVCTSGSGAVQAETDLTENVQAQNQLLLTGRMPALVRCTRCWAAVDATYTLCLFAKYLNEFENTKQSDSRDDDHKNKRKNVFPKISCQTCANSYR
jgi:hypothetical protein